MGAQDSINSSIAAPYDQRIASVTQAAGAAGEAAAAQNQRMQAYNALGLTDLSDSTQRVLLKNFPNTGYLKPGGVKKKVPWWRLWDPDW